MSLREWLVAIGTLVILGIVIDGIRRMRRARKESMAISSGMGADDLRESPLDAEHNPELPNGGARTISRETLEQRGYVKQSGKSRFANPEPKPTRPIVAPAGSKASTGQRSASKPDTQAPRQVPQESNEPSSAELDERQYEEHEPHQAPGQESDSFGDTGWGALEVEPEVDGEILGEARTVKPTSSPEPENSADTAPDEQEAADSLPPMVTSEVEEDTARREAPVSQDPNRPLAGANRPEAQEVVVINVLAKAGQDFQGTALKELFEACGLELGDMDIYHRHEEADTTSPVQFSVANAVEPGTFRPADMPSLSTPGISFFMSLPGPSNALQAFDFMLETAQCVVRNMGGDLKDERRSVMTPQTVEHCRQRIREFDRKQRSRRHP